MIEMAGGVNAASDGTGWKYSVERLVQKNPDILIYPNYYDASDIKSTPGYKDLKAIKGEKLLVIDGSLLDQQAPRLADGLMQLAKLIHPEIFGK
jgi:iron complex transport system substrate-binding protein